MTSKLKLVIIGFTLSIIMMKPALALDTMSCGTHVISVGQDSDPTMNEVLEKCGEPDERSGKIWIYKKSSSISHTLHFNSHGMLISIE
jgi:hypothetical protein